MVALMLFCWYETHGGDYNRKYNNNEAVKGLDGTIGKFTNAVLTTRCFCKRTLKKIGKKVFNVT